jgi:hypothetical protein
MIKLNCDTLEERRARIKVQTMFKARKKKIDIPLNHLIENLRKSRNIDKSNTYQLPMSNVDSHLHSFYPSCIRL